ncbi:MAG: putative uncharacterized small rane protein [Hyphomicrobiales bacterium]|nr:putative uncharacterized small rane protein [Hyphomicrobiales bacterium]
MTLASRLLLAFAGLMGAGGVALAAAGAHMGGDNLATASTFLLVHAAAVTGALARPRPGRALLAAAALLALGAALFGGDLALRALAGVKLFAMAAPLGGIVMILGWLGLAAAAAAHREGEPGSCE